STPVAITANITYIASHHSGIGYYASLNYFQNTGFDNAPLHALKEGVSGSNGVYAYGSGTAFPNQSFSSTNYWADVVCVPAPTQSVAAFSGTPQSTTVATAFGSALQAKVVDGSSNPVSGVAVTFTAPSSGASATFGGLTSVTVNTDGSGIA